MKERRRTSTSNFGVGRRENHDATGVLRAVPRAGASPPTTPSLAPAAGRRAVRVRRRPVAWTRWPTARSRSSSPRRPYFAGKQYEEELERDGVPSSYLEYLELLTDVFAECVRKLEPGGRIAVNVANLGRKPYRSLSADVIRILQDDLGLLLRGEIVWQKGEGASGSCAWGSFRSAANPVLRDITERVVVASKGRFDRARSAKQRAAAGPAAREHDDDRGLHGAHARRVVDPVRERPAGRPPGAVPRRAARAADPALHVRRRPRARPVHGQRLDAGGRGADWGGATSGYDLDPAYVEIARRRVAEAMESMSRTEATDTEAGAPEAVGTVPGGRTAKDSAERALVDAGFTITGRNQRVKAAGVSVDFLATDATGAPWMFDVAGPARTHRGGMLQTDVVWRALGRSHALRGWRGATPLVVLTTAAPRRPSEGDSALQGRRACRPLRHRRPDLDRRLRASGAIRRGRCRSAATARVLERARPRAAPPRLTAARPLAPDGGTSLTPDGGGHRRSEGGVAAVPGPPSRPPVEGRRPARYCERMSVIDRHNVRISGSRTASRCCSPTGSGATRTCGASSPPASSRPFRVVLFDHVGAGGSDSSAYDPQRYSSLDGYADDVLEICRELDLRDVVFVGHSVSAMIGVLAADRGARALRQARARRAVAALHRRRGVRRRVRRGRHRRAARVAREQLPRLVERDGAR